MKNRNTCLVFFCFVLAGIRLKFLVSFQQLVLCVCLIVYFYTLISFFFFANSFKNT